MANVRRLDRGEYRKAKVTPEGFLQADGFFTRVGVFKYAMPDGSILRELRLPEEVFKPGSMQTFAAVPVTDGHPPAFLNDQNATQFTKGWTGDQVKQEDDHLAGTLKIIDGGLKKKVDAGDAQELSLGYTCRLEESPGIWKDSAGQPHEYDVIQRDIVGNHCAVVTRGRAGPKARIKLDALDAELVQDDDNSGKKDDPPKPKEDDMNLVKMKVDGLDAEVTEQARQVLERAFAKNDEAVKALETKATKLDADFQTLKGKHDAQTDELKKAQVALKEATDPAKVQDAVKSRLELEKRARKVLGADAKLDEMATVKDVQVAVLKKLNKDFKPDGLADAYIQGRFDHAVDSYKSSDLANLRREITPGAGGKKNDGTDHNDDEVVDEQAAMVARNTARWKPAKSA